MNKYLVGIEVTTTYHVPVLSEDEATAYRIAAEGLFSEDTKKDDYFTEECAIKLDCCNDESLTVFINSPTLEVG